jgi:hypothetical protein
MEASTQSPAGSVQVGIDGITLGRYGFDAQRVQAARVWTSEPRRDAWSLLLLLFAGLIYFFSAGFKGGVFSWSVESDPLRATLGVVLVIAAPFLVWSLFMRDNTRVYLVQLKRDGRWANAWATLDAAAAENVAATIRRAIIGDQVALTLAPGFVHESDWLLFGDNYIPIGEVASGRRTLRQANPTSELGRLLSSAGFLFLALHRLVEVVTGPNSAFGWLVIMMIVAGLLLIIVGFALDPVSGSERSSRYVHFVQLRGTFGKQIAYATINQAEAEAIVAEINKAIAAR